MSTYDKILERVMALNIIDSHEHLPSSEAKCRKDTDVLQEYLIHYFSSDLMSAGLKAEELAYVCDHTQPLLQRWKVVEPFWNLARNTGYGRALDASAQAIYGTGRICAQNIEALNDAFMKARLSEKSHYHHVLKEMSAIEYSVLDSDLDCDQTYFRSAFHTNRFTMPDSWEDMEKAGREAGIAVTCLEDWMNVCRTLMEDGYRRGAVTLKCTLAYNRTLSFGKPTRHEAEAAFNDMLAFKVRPPWDNGHIRPPKAFEDYMFHFILHFANERGLVVQIHTGLQEGIGNNIANSDPTLLSNLLSLYTNVRFDLFHIGYPYYNVMSVLGKIYPNVYVNMCWAHIISPAACVAALDDWLDSMPVNKIVAFGGDYMLVDGVYAHQLFARQNISRTLAGKVDKGLMDVDEAVWMAQRMFYDNPKALYGN